MLVQLLSAPAFSPNLERAGPLLVSAYALDQDPQQPRALLESSSFFFFPLSFRILAAVAQQLSAPLVETVTGPITTTVVADAMVPRQFKINRKNFSRHYDIETTDGRHMYYVDMRTFGFRNPDLTLHEGPDNKAPVVAVCHMPALSNSFKIGVGDPSSSRLDAMLWENLAKESLTKSGWRWSADMPDGTRAGLVWKRTKSSTVEGMAMPSISSRNFKLQDVATGEILAVFTSKRTYKTCGILQVNVERGHDFELMVLATFLTLYEEARREAQRSWSAGS
ncbi:hypothetical protein Purlil1_13169 [Purpureocillium lilacinum]|uniref:Uncharacterized protein n=1 Tax=Purpureocillium lilacinum TaxID=33203 RepID=A0ABR0BF04_PURLI|nr:hypothetical protein Purlil1_13169 [Purpureocillium lilacinum]